LTTSVLDEGMRRELANWDDAAMALHWVGAEGVILWANRTELEMLGYAPGDYIGHNICEFHEDVGRCAEILAKLTAGEVLHDYPARLLHHDGSICEVRIDSSVRWEDGKFTHTRCFTRPWSGGQ